MKTRTLITLAALMGAVALVVLGAAVRNGWVTWTQPAVSDR